MRLVGLKGQCGNIKKKNKKIKKVGDEGGVEVWCKCKGRIAYLAFLLCALQFPAKEYLCLGWGDGFKTGLVESLEEGRGNRTQDEMLNRMRREKEDGRLMNKDWKAWKRWRRRRKDKRGEKQKERMAVVRLKTLSEGIILPIVGITGEGGSKALLFQEKEKRGTQGEDWREGWTCLVFRL